MAEAGRDHGMTLAPGDWVYFAQAVFEVEEELGLPRAEAETLLRSAVAEGKIATVAVPSFAPPLAPDLPARARAPQERRGPSAAGAGEASAGARRARALRKGPR